MNNKDLNSGACRWCGAKEKGCDCLDRMACPIKGTIGHFGCGMHPCGCPKFVPHPEGCRRYARGEHSAIRFEVLNGDIETGKFEIKCQETHIFPRLSMPPRLVYLGKVYAKHTYDLTKQTLSYVSN